MGKGKRKVYDVPCLNCGHSLLEHHNDKDAWACYHFEKGWWWRLWIPGISAGCTCEVFVDSYLAQVCGFE